MQSIKFTNKAVEGVGHGHAEEVTGRIVCVVVGFDYKGYNAMRDRALEPLSSTKDGIRFASLAKASGAEVFEYYDNPALNPNMGFPHRDQVVAKIAQLGQELGPQDSFVWFYGGHGMESLEGDADADEEDGKDEELCFVEPDGQYMPLQSDHIAHLLANSFNPQTQMVIVTDCCQSGTVCDLNRSFFQGRPICHLSSSPDTDDAIELEVDYTYGDGGAFTASLLESIEDLIAEGRKAFSVGLLHNKALALYSNWAPGQGYDPMKFYFECPAGLDPAAISWPLIPPQGWCVSTLMDDRKGSKAAAEHKAEVQRTGGDVVRLKQNLDAQAAKVIGVGAAGARIAQQQAAPAAAAAAKYASTTAGAPTVKRMAKPAETSEYYSGGVQPAQRTQYSGGSPNVIRAQPTSSAQPIRTTASGVKVYSGGSGGGLQPSPARVYSSPSPTYSSPSPTYSSPSPQMYSPSPAPRYAAPSPSFGQQYASPYGGQPQYSGFGSPNVVYAGQPGMYQHRHRHVEVGSPANRVIVGGGSSQTLSATSQAVSYGRTISASTTTPASVVVPTPTSSVLVPSGTLTAPVVHVI